MPINRIEVVKGVGTSGNTCTVTFGTPTTLGELVVVWFVAAPDGTTAATCTDNQSNTYTGVSIRFNFNFHESMGWYYLLNCPSGISSITITGDASDLGTDTTVFAAHYTGVLGYETSVPVPNNPGNSGSPWASTGINTTHQNCLLVGGMYWNSSGTPTAGAGWSTIQTRGDGGGNTNAWSDQLVSVTQTGVTFNGTFAGGSPANEYPSIIAFFGANTLPSTTVAGSETLSKKPRYMNFAPALVDYDYPGLIPIVTAAPTVAYDNDAENQLPNPAYQLDEDVVDDSVENITLPPLVVDDFGVGTVDDDPS